MCLVDSYDLFDALQFDDQFSFQQQIFVLFVTFVVILFVVSRGHTPPEGCDCSALSAGTQWF